MKDDFTPLGRLKSLEEFSLKFWGEFKKLEEKNMKLENRVSELEKMLRPKGIPYGMIYEALKEMERCTSPPSPDQTEADWEERFIEKFGTQEEFINERQNKNTGGIKNVQTSNPRQTKEAASFAGGISSLRTD